MRDSHSHFLYNRFSRINYTIIYLATGTSPQKRDFKRENFEEALGLLQAGEAWTGQLNQECDAFLKANDIPITT